MDDATLRRIVQQIVGPVPGLYIAQLPQGAKEKLGARFIVAPSRRELPGGSPSPDEFLQALLHLPMPAGITALSAINLIVSKILYLDPVHRQLNARFLTSQRLRELQQFVKDSPPLPDAAHVQPRELTLVAASRARRSLVSFRGCFWSVIWVLRLCAGRLLGISADEAGPGVQLAALPQRRLEAILVPRRLIPHVRTIRPGPVSGLRLIFDPANSS